MSITHLSFSVSQLSQVKDRKKKRFVQFVFLFEHERDRIRLVGGRPIEVQSEQATGRLVVRSVSQNER